MATGTSVGFCFRCARRQESSVVIATPCLAQYSRRVSPLFAKPSRILRISRLLRISPFSAESSYADKMGSSDAYLRKEYDFSKGVVGKYARRYAAGTNLVLLDSDVAGVFPDSRSVSEALQSLVRNSGAP